jgi:alpha-ketoglutarate-dependent taurine dioxygenase
MDEVTFRQVNEIFLEHHVILFRGQSLSRAQHVEFARRFGEPFLVPPTAAVDEAEDFPEVSLVVNPPGRRIIGGAWHSDRSECPRPASASLLRCVELPGLGGDTMFANMHRAYDLLSEGMKELLANLEGVYLDRRPDFDLSTPERYLQSRLANPAAAQPVVRVHNESGRKALYVNTETNHFVGMSEAESKPIIDYLTDWATRPENVYRHVWQEDDLVIWDNRSVLHMALADYDRCKVRHMERVSVMGDESGYEYFGPIGRWPAVERLGAA